MAHATSQTANAMSGHYCPRCNQTHTTRPPGGFCPDCPDEPVYDLSTQDGRSLAYAAERGERELASQAATHPAIFAGTVTALVVFAVGVALTFFLRRSFGDAPLYVAGVAGLVAGTIVGRSVQRRRSRKAISGLPSEAERAGVEQACTSCGAVSLDELAPGAYRCRHCGYEGGPNFAELRQR